MVYQCSAKEKANIPGNCNVYGGGVQPEEKARMVVNQMLDRGNIVIQSCCFEKLPTSLFRR